MDLKEPSHREASKKDDDQVLLESKAEEQEFEELQNQKKESMQMRNQDEPEGVYNIEKTQDEIKEQGYLQNFFECPYEYQ